MSHIRIPVAVVKDAATPPRVLRTLTNAELLRVAEEAFPTPSPIIAQLMQRLYASPETRSDFNCPDSDEHRLHCPQCGTTLQIELQDRHI